MTTKNPFEIRADVLEMAKDYMDKQVQLNVQYWEKMMEIGKATIDEAKAANVYTPYSMEELMKKAQEMYSFVSKKD
jgi:transcriptional regulator